MSKMSKAIAVLGVVAGLGVAALPLSSYAAENYNQSAQAQVQVEVGGAIAISVDSGNATTPSLVDLGDLKINGVTTNTTPLVVTVKSNADDGKYDLTLKSATAETALVNENGAKIPAIDGAAAKLVGGTAAWGYFVGDTADENTEYTGVTADGATLKTDQAIATSNTGSDSATYKNMDQTKVIFNAAAAGDQQEGVYSQTVVFTATVK